MALPKLREAQLHVTGDATEGSKTTSFGLTLLRLGAGQGSFRGGHVNLATQIAEADGQIVAVGRRLTAFRLRGVMGTAGIDAEGNSMTVRASIGGEFRQSAITVEAGLLTHRSFALFEAGIQHHGVLAHAAVTADIRGLSGASITLPGGFACSASGE